MFNISRDYIVAVTRGIPSNETVRGLGSGETSTYSQHAYAIAFWQEALALDGDDAVPPNMHAFAEEEIARHQAAIDGVPFMSAEDKRKAGAVE